MSNETSVIGWDSPSVGAAVGVCVGAGLATAIGGATVFLPNLWKRLPQSKILATSLALSAGVMLYVSFIEIFTKSHDEIISSGVSKAAAMGITTGCFFGGMFVCVLLEVLVHRILKRWKPVTGICVHRHDDATSTTKREAAEVELELGSGPEVVGEADGEADVEADGQTRKLEAAASADDEAALRLKEPDLHDAGLFRMGLMTALAIAIHNFPEGLATFLATVRDVRVGASLGVAIAVHNIPEGICVAMPIYYSTGSKWKGFWWALLSGLSEPIGGVIGFAALQSAFTPFVFGIVFSMVGGMMVFIVCHELIPAALHYMGSTNETTAWLVGGMVVMALSLVLFLT